jgi:glycosyltransferase involved in cell wall biosynthesis
VTGWIDDDALRQCYDRYRVAVVPLRFGAGVKSKVVEALRYALPIITTPVGAQGLEGVEAIAPIVETAEAFAEATLRLLENDAVWRAQAARQASFAQDRFSRQQLSQQLIAAIENRTVSIPH